jgi:hypothetical protein
MFILELGHIIHITIDNNPECIRTLLCGYFRFFEGFRHGDVQEGGREIETRESWRDEVGGGSWLSVITVAHEIACEILGSAPDFTPHHITSHPRY